MKDFTLFWRLASTETTRNSFDNEAVKTISLRFPVTALFDSNKKKHFWTLLVQEDSDERISWKSFPNAIFLSTN